MATITDTLETLLKLTGLAPYLAGFGAITLAVKTFAAEENQLFRNERLFNRLGINASFSETVKQVNALARVTGYSAVEIEQVVGQLAQAGVQGQAFAKAIKDIGDAASGNAQGLGFAETGEAFVKSVLGRERALEKFGITLQSTGSRMGNLARTEFEFEKRFFGDAGQRSLTLNGSLDRLSESFRQFFSALGNMPAVVHVFNRLADGMNSLTSHMAAFIDKLQYFSPLLFYLNQAAARDHEGNPAANAGKNGLATERTAQQIADNTKMTADAVEKAILGGPGFRAKQAFTFRDARLAMSI